MQNDAQETSSCRYRCVDAEQTTKFYTELLGLKLAAALVHNYVPSTKKSDPHNHIFFEMDDGSFIAFFDVMNDTRSSSVPENDWAQHLALETESHERAELLAQRLRDNGVEVIGPIGHGFCDSYYFYDPTVIA
ncbi:VOC family protein [Sphingobium sp. LB126]|uniref:VOC family protein n=1 Tax=Sphingobium sp. LB126 TaxID=1983755 RepID=UPI0018D585C3|nr:VOC family protein [Sphingobium sp. LB126]